MSDAAATEVGTLYLVSTPIGNLGDTSERAGRILGSVEVVLAEDTRHSSRLLQHLGVSPRLLSLHQHNEETRIPRVLKLLQGGGEVALVSDAGTPLVSDPGERLVRRAIEGGHRVVPVPGPSAVLAALVGSGLPTSPFVFLGFVPRKGKDRTEFLERVAAAVETVVAFESPERLRALLDELIEYSGAERRAAVARELTKVHEEFRRGTLGQLSRYYGDDESSGGRTVRGEITVVVAPADDSVARERVDLLAGDALARALLEEGLSPSRAARELARRLGIARNRAYDLVQHLVAPDRDNSSPSDPGSDGT